MRLSWVPRQKSKEELRLETEREFFAAVAADDPHALRLLLARGVNPHCRNSMGMTAMELATERRKRKALSYLQKQIAAPGLLEPASATTGTLNAPKSGALPPVVTVAGSSTSGTPSNSSAGVTATSAGALPKLQ